MLRLRPQGQLARRMRCNLEAPGDVSPSSGLVSPPELTKKLGKQQRAGSLLLPALRVFKSMQ